MKRLLRTIRKRFATGLLPRLLYLLIRLLHAIMRFRVVGADIPRAFHERGEGIIGVFWHSRLLMMPYAYQGRDMHVLISSHSDGEIIGNVTKSFGLNVVRGSSSKRGGAAMLELVRLVRNNSDLAITPDGPRGPAEVVNPGVAQIARVTGHPVIPAAYSASRVKRFDSWDRFLLPYPFSRGVIVWGEPLFYLPGEELEGFRLRVERALAETTQRADELAAQ